MNITDCASTKEHMEYYENRLKTFDTYPKQMLPDKIPLARAGLYYTGKSDMCQCFLCHVKLNAWERDDDAIKEHYKWSPQCEYIKMVGAPQKTGFTFGSSTSKGRNQGVHEYENVTVFDTKYLLIFGRQL